MCFSSEIKPEHKAVNSSKCLTQVEQSKPTMTLLWWSDLQTGEIAVLSERGKAVTGNLMCMFGWHLEQFVGMMRLWCHTETQI